MARDGAAIRAHYQRSGRAVPAEALPPPLSERGLLAYRCFGDLQADRSFGMAGPLPVHWAAIDAWADRHGIDGDAFDDLAALVRAADQAFLSTVVKKT